MLSYSFMIFFQWDEVNIRLLKFGIPSFLFVLCIINLESRFDANNKLNKFIIGIGNASYATYLIHFYIVKSVTRILDSRLNLLDDSSLLGVVITLTASLFAGQMFYKYIDKPIMIFCKKRIL